MDTKDLINALNDLIETCKDGEYGFSSSAEHLRNAEVRELFMRRADGCHTAAAELRAQVQALGGDAEDSGTVVGAAHRGWVAVKGKLAGYSDKAILEETERGEDSAMNRYRRVLQMDLPQDLRGLIERQFLGVQRNHEQVRSLRDHARAAER